MKVLLVGCNGYVGSVLHPYLAGSGHEVTGYDIELPKVSGQKIIRGDVRNTDLLAAACEDKEAVIYLAGMTNNDECMAKPAEADSINQHAFPPFLKRAKHLRVRRFIYASSVAAYGNSEYELAEIHSLNPTTVYGHYKAHNENWILATESEDFACVRVRSASVCGPSPRFRPDITVNKMCHDALTKGVITVNGGEQVRSHVHINELCRFYCLMLNMPVEKLRGHAFNVVGENMKVGETAALVADMCKATREIKPATDNRSYAVSGDKASILLGFRPSLTVADAVREIARGYGRPD